MDASIGLGYYVVFDLGWLVNGVNTNLGVICHYLGHLLLREMGHDVNQFTIFKICLVGQYKARHSSTFVIIVHNPQCHQFWGFSHILNSAPINFWLYAHSIFDFHSQLLYVLLHPTTYYQRPPVSPLGIDVSELTCVGKLFSLLRFLLWAW